MAATKCTRLNEVNLTADCALFHCAFVHVGCNKRVIHFSWNLKWLPEGITCESIHNWRSKKTLIMCYILNYNDIGRNYPHKLFNCEWPSLGNDWELKAGWNIVSWSKRSHHYFVQNVLSKQSHSYHHFKCINHAPMFDLLEVDLIVDVPYSHGDLECYRCKCKRRARHE